MDNEGRVWQCHFFCLHKWLYDLYEYWNPAFGWMIKRPGSERWRKWLHTNWRETQKERVQCTSNAWETQHSTDRTTGVWKCLDNPTRQKRIHREEKSYVSQYLLQWVTPQCWDQCKTLNWGILEMESKNRRRSGNGRNKSQFMGLYQTCFYGSFQSSLPFRCLENSRTSFRVLCFGGKKDGYPLPPKLWLKTVYYVCRFSQAFEPYVGFVNTQIIVKLHSRI